MKMVTKAKAPIKSLSAPIEETTILGTTSEELKGVLTKLSQQLSSMERTHEPKDAPEAVSELDSAFMRLSDRLYAADYQLSVLTNRLSVVMNPSYETVADCEAVAENRCAPILTDIYNATGKVVDLTDKINFILTNLVI
jgi:hypothetical protein